MPRRRYPGLVTNEDTPTETEVVVEEHTNEQAQELRIILNADKVKPKSAKMDGVDYLVVPTVLICEGVHNGLFYPSTELRKFPQAWNGRTIPIYHPTDLEGNSITANSPETITKSSVGTLFNVKWDGKAKKLKGEAWINPTKCEALGDNGKAVLNAVTTGTTMEVSTGLFVDVVDEGGTWNGETYTGVAVNHRPDHFALLPGGVGACSVADGAGFPRNNAEAKALSLSLRSLESGLRALRDVGLNERQRILRDALQKKYGSKGSADSPSSYVYVYVEEVFDNEVVFNVEGSGASQMKRVGYSVDGKGVITIGPDAPVPVQRVVSYETVTNAESKSKKGTGSMDPKDKTEAAAPEANGDVKPKAKAHTIDELLGNADDAVKADIQDALMAQKAVREGLISKITANKSNTFTAEELGKMSTPQLGKIATLAEVPAAPEKTVVTEPETKTEAETEETPAKPKGNFAGNDAGAAPKTVQKPVANSEQADGSGVPLPPVINWGKRD